MNNFLNNNNNSAQASILQMNRKLEEANAEEKAKLYNLPYVDFRSLPADLNAMSFFSAQEAVALQAIPFFKDLSELKIATVDPNLPALKQKLAEYEGKMHVSLYVISSSGFKYAFGFYKNIVTPKQHKDESVRLSKDTDYVAGLKSFTGTSDEVTKFLELIFGSAMQLEASDIHLEPEEKQVKVRLRLDGVLQDVLSLPRNLQGPVISRIKILSQLKLNVQNLPQDGRMSFLWGSESVDVRVATLPSAFGEGVVLRLLGVGAAKLAIHELGLVGRSYEIIEKALQKPNGMIVTTGPTGSGKTTTLYSFLQQLNNPGVKIITIEDPIEYKLEGIQQTPVDSRVEFGFARALRAILRQDPDIVMVGEIRDAETADTALQASLTGHVVLSTLHTNDSFGAVPRLISMGMKPFIIAPAINAVIAQRLVRRLCSKCAVEGTLAPGLLERVQELLASFSKNAGVSISQELKFKKAVGCQVCHETGYKGRVGIYEVIDVNDAMKDLILKNASMLDMKKQALADGTLTMIQDGLLKALQGLTDVEEVFRVAGS